MARMDSLVYFIDDSSPAIVRKLSTQGGEDFDVQLGQTFKLRVRPERDDAIILDKVMTADVVEDTLTYQPVAGDFDAEGVFRAWVYADLGGGVVQSTDEFEIIVLEHAPGRGVRIGPAAFRARALAPIAWDSLRGVKNYGDVELQNSIELSKTRVYGHVVPVADEAAMDIRVIDFIAKKALVESILPAVIDFWTNQTMMQSTRGNSMEIKSYPDRIKAIEELIKRYAADLLAQLAEVIAIIGPVGTMPAGPVLIDGGQPLTPSLNELAPIPRSSAWLTGWVQ